MTLITQRIAFVLAFAFGVPILQLAAAVTIDTVPVGNPGNAPMFDLGGRPYGEVDYSYRIGKYEVTNAQYAEFLNAVDRDGTDPLELYNFQMATDARGGIRLNADASLGSKYSAKAGRGNNPVVFISWYDSVRFTNWLNNGQGSGDTETGAYTLLGAAPVPSNGLSVARNPGAKWFLPNDAEWFKAAYHKNDGVTGNYWLYPTSSNTMPFSASPPGNGAPDPSNVVNHWYDDGIANGYNDGYALTGSTTLIGTQNYLTDIGAYISSPSPYRTFDQAGNVAEWDETPIHGTERWVRGGSWLLTGCCDLSSPVGTGDSVVAWNEISTVGFRVATIPEPSSMVLLILGLVGIVRLSIPLPNNSGDGVAKFGSASEATDPAWRSCV